ncbi:MAG TPA: MBL fold metallo-hydrolase [Verrucomicrobiota bacterium]|nr:MBL fold metallo-hydrolase [Verrucomicrobiales bacterium]HRI12178.1 MBL fold metallo-hydrolase [Verrucomicrobiota bacterium]
MSALTFQFVREAVYLPDLALWLDAHHRVGPNERAFVSHAHSDHTAAHARVIVSPPTQQLMRARVPGEREEHVLEFGRQYSMSEFGHSEAAGAITLLPAGHILGSAMAWIEAADKTFLYTGDFKLRRGFCAEACEPRRADVLVMETTFGRPRYIFPPAAETMAGVVRFCCETLASGATPVLLGYSLGKAQEILTGLSDAGLPIALSPPVAKITEIYEALGRRFPSYTALNSNLVGGRVILAPPQSSLNALRRQFGPCRVAVLTGWAIDSNCQYRYRADAAFPLSDHADFAELVEFVQQVQPRQVYTLHGFACDFAAHLRRLGFDARALGRTEQLELAF